MAASASDSTATAVIMWSLMKSDKTPAESQLQIGPNADTTGTETTFVDDQRRLVNLSDLQPGGKYRSIIKLQIRYQEQTPDDERFAQGTGWLIKPDLLVTAGHCAFDHTHQLGKASEVKAYLGYNGKASLNTSNVQFRMGTRIATPAEWIKSDVNRNYDVSFIQLNEPFHQVEPIRYQPTPAVERFTLGVVGYPADKAVDGEHAAQMYEMYKDVSFDLSGTHLHMLEYTISSYAGQSGSPVLLKDKNISIGAHVYGYGTKNSASVIKGTYGNNYKVFIDSFSTTMNAEETKNYAASSAPEDVFGSRPPTDAEDFWATFKKVASVDLNVGTAVLGTGAPFMGPLAGPIAAAAGTALGIAGNLIANRDRAESVFEPAPDHKAYAARAVLAEAAFQTVLNMPQSTIQKYPIAANMQQSYKKNKPLLAGVAKKFAPSLMDSALRIAVSSASTTGKPDGPYPRVTLPATTESGMDGKGNDFAAALKKAAQDDQDDHAEGFIDFIGPVAGTIVRVVPPVISSIGKLTGGGESSIEPATQDHNTQYLETLCHRSMMGEAALKALMEIPPEELRAEGFLTGMLGVAKEIGSPVIRVAPSVVRTVTPIVQSLIASQESSGPGTVPQGPQTPISKPKHGVPNSPGKEPTLLDLLGSDTSPVEFTNGADHTVHSVSRSIATQSAEHGPEEGYPEEDISMRGQTDLSWTLDPHPRQDELGSPVPTCVTKSLRVRHQQHSFIQDFPRFLEPNPVH